MRRTAALFLATVTALMVGTAVRSPSDARMVPDAVRPTAPSVPGGTMAAPAAAPSGAALAEQAHRTGGPAVGATRPAGEEGSFEDRREEDGRADDATSGGRAPQGGQETGPQVVTSFLVAPAPTAGAVAGTGPRWRYSVEVEAALGIDPGTFAAEVRAALADARSWSRDRTLEQVSDPLQARIRVVLATPGTVDDLCRRAGLDTAGIYSCWNGTFAALNAWRWEVGAEGFPDLATYRTYLVNHEFGHGLGYGHRACPGPDAVAPVMMQQSKGLDGCLANGWPHP